MRHATDLIVPDTERVSAAIARGGIEVIDAVAAEWRGLCDTSGWDAPFYRPEWIRAFVSAFAPSAGLAIATVRADGKLIAILPLISELGRIGHLPARKLRSAGNTHTCRFELVHDPRWGDAVVEPLWHALLDEPGWDVLDLEDVPEDGALAALAQCAAREGYATHRAFGLDPPYLDLGRAHGRFASILETLDPKFRSNLRRRKRKLESRGTLVLTRGERVDEQLEAFYALERRGWKGAEKSAISCSPATRAFYDSIARFGEQTGSLAIYALQCGGAPTAMYLGLHYRDRYYLLKTAYDETLHDCSPGQLLTREALEDLVSRGCVEFDFLGGMMDWKADWAPSRRNLVHLHIFRGAAGRALQALQFGLRPAMLKVARRMGAIR